MGYMKNRRRNKLLIGQFYRVTYIGRLHSRFLPLEAEIVRFGLIQALNLPNYVT